MSSSSKKDKLGQVIQNFFLKAANIVIQSRTMPLQTASNAGNTKTNRWFNIDTLDPSREELKPWRSANSTFAPIIIETFLDLRDLTVKQSLVLKDDDNNSWNINTKKSEIVMERWLIEIDPSIADDSNIELPLLYKKLIIMFRFLYTITRLLPTYKLFRRLEKVKLTKSPLKIGVRVLEGNRPIVSRGRIGLSRPIITTSEDHLQQKIVTPVTTSIGTLKISVSYRKQIDFQLIDNEETLSSHFLNIDKNRANSGTSVSMKKAFRTGTASPPSSSPLLRNESNASIAQALKIQRTGSLSAQAASLPKSITSSVGSTSHYVPIPTGNTLDQLSSSGSTPKYSSSFQKVARRSSLRRSSSIDPGISTSVERGTITTFKVPSPGSNLVDDDLNDFLRLIDNKQDLKLSYSPNIKDSLGKFQQMRTKNEELSESLTASVYSKSQSPPPLSNRPMVPVTTSSQHVPSALQSLVQYSGSPRWNGMPTSITKRLSEGDSSSDSLILRDPPKHISSSTSSPRYLSASPSSGIMRRDTRSFSIGPSNPTIATSTTTAIMHRISPDNSVSHGHHSKNDHLDDEDDELLFAMSDMNLPKHN